MATSPSLLDRFGDLLRSQTLSEDAHLSLVEWGRRFIYFHRGRRPEDRPDNRFRHPADMGVPEVADFLASLQTERLSLGDQARARTALELLYARLLGQPLGEFALPAPVPQPGKLMERVRHCLRLGHYALDTESASVNWIRRFLLFHNNRHPREMGPPEIEAYLGHLATDQHVAASTQNQAFAALLYLYHVVLEIKLPCLDALRAERRRYLPVVLSRHEVRRLLDVIAGAGDAYRLMAGLLYGAGLHLRECCRLRVKDVYFQRNLIVVRGGKGDKDCAVMLPRSLRAALDASRSLR